MWNPGRSPFSKVTVATTNRISSHVITLRCQLSRASTGRMNRKDPCTTNWWGSDLKGGVARLTTKLQIYCLWYFEPE